MAAAVPQPQALSAATGAAAAPLQFKSTTEANSYVLGLVVERLASRTGVPPEELSLYCYLLARGIDNALTKNDVPTVAHALPALVKQVYQHRTNTSLQSAIMVLMMTVKKACTVGWFDPVDTKELLGMASKLCSSFCTSEGATVEESNAVHIVAKVISRFFPQLKLCRLLVSFEAKRGYNVLMTDFHIQKNLPPEETIRLFVAQTDNLETSSCIISPPQVSFLVNGKGVERRTNISLDTGPQFPTDITKMLKRGINIIQAVGCFSGNYIIAVAYMTKIVSSVAPVLKDYVLPSVREPLLDPEIVEGPSRISLNCPISLGHIKTPVKGHLCKHHQCFDYDNYMGMNLRRPTWRCPICNQPVSCMDICIDRNMAKASNILLLLMIVGKSTSNVPYFLLFQILSKVSMDVADVVISVDGSWEVASEQDRSGTPTWKRNDNIESEPNKNRPAGVVDLTIEENGETSMEQNEEAEAALSFIQADALHCHANKIGNDNCEIVDKKPNLHIQDLPASEAPQEPPFTDRLAITQAGSYHIAGESSAIHVPDFRMVGTLESLIPNSVLNPGVGVAHAQSVPSVPVSEPGLYNQHQTQVWQLSENMLLQRPHFENAIIHSEAERLMPTHASRVPIVNHALPGQTQISCLPQSTLTHSSSSITSNGSPSICHESISSMTMPNRVNTLICGRSMQQASRNLGIASSILPHPSMSQPIGLPASNLLCTRAPLDQQRGADTYRGQVQSSVGLQYHHRQQMNLRRQQVVAQYANNLTEPPRVPSVRLQQASQGAGGIATGSSINNTNPHLAAQQAAYAASLQTGEFQTHALRNVASFPLTSINSLPSTSECLPNIIDVSLAVGSSDGFPRLPAEQSWQPTWQMRGSLLGSAYSAALSHYLARSTQTLPARSSVVSSVGAASSDQLYAYGSSRMNIQRAQTGRLGDMTSQQGGFQHQT